MVLRSFEGLVIVRYFCGFMGGESDQRTPYLFRDRSQIMPWTGKPGYNLTTDMAGSRAIGYKRLFLWTLGLVAGAYNHPNCLVLPFSFDLIRSAA
jgi:hypothetical protein